MRTTLLLLATVILLGGGFAAYWAFQPAGAVQNPAAAQGGLRPLATRPAESAYTVGGGKGAWLKKFDLANRLTNQFRADQYDPQKEGFVRVTRPEVQFFLKGGQWIKVTGRTGDVYVAGLPAAGDSGGDVFASGGGSGPQMPSRGRLQDVRIYLYDTPDAAQPSLDLEVNNAAFDNESFRIFTEAYTDADGRQIAADQVKVTVRGNYEFDGRGLTIRWNDRDQRLELLEIAHGERLVVKNLAGAQLKLPGEKKTRSEDTATALAGNGGQSAARAGAQSGDGAAQGRSSVSPEPQANAVADSQPSTHTNGVRVDAGADASASESTPYSIWFHDNVQVMRGDETVATSNVIEVYYALRNTEEKSPTTAPASREAKLKQSDPAPVAQGESSAAAVPAPATQPTAATKPADEQLPLIVYWTGKLRIVPSVTAPPVPLAPGQTAVQMRGTPVRLTYDSAEIRCPAVTYRTSDGGVTLHNSEAFPHVEVAQFETSKRTGKPDLTLFSQSVEYAPEKGIATLIGDSRAVFPADETGKSGETATATWTRQGIVRFAEVGGASVVQNLDLEGDVDVQHPQVGLRSQKLALAFAALEPADVSPKAAAATTRPAAARAPAVRQVTASEGVHCVLRDGSKNPRELFAEHLDLATVTDAAGKLYPKVVKARGNVRATQGGEELTAQQLDLLLAPAVATAGSPAKKGAAKADAAGAFDASSLVLERMVAKTGVKAVSANGTQVTAATMVVTNVGGKPQVGLSGNPARVTDAQGLVLTSQKIVIPGDNEARAVGSGTLHAPLEAADGEPRRFVDVSWTKSALLNGNLKDNQIEVIGDVRATLPDADAAGTVYTAESQRIIISMAPAPAAAATPAASGNRAAPNGEKKPANAKPKAEPEDADEDDSPLASMKLDALDGKEVSRIILSEDAVLHSRLAAADGTVLREMRIESSLLRYDVAAQRFLAPRPGRMLVRDHSPAAAVKTVAAAPGVARSKGLGSQRGATAFQWGKSMEYDGVGLRAVMEKDVLVAYKPDAEGEPPVQLRADRVVAAFNKTQQSGAARPAGSAADGLEAPAVELKSVTAEGNVNVLRGGEELNALVLTYDPLSNTIVARGRNADPAVFSRNGRATMSASELHWNTETWDIKVIGAAARVSGR